MGDVPGRSGGAHTHTHTRDTGGGVMKILCEESRALRRGKEEPFHVSIFMFMHGAGARRPRPQTPRIAAGLEEEAAGLQAAF